MKFTGFEARAGDASLALAMLAAGATLALMLLEVVLRYGFAAPTVWSPELVGMTNGAVFVLAAGPALRAGTHVSVDALSRLLSGRAQAAILASFHLALLLPVLLFVIDAGIDRAWGAYTRGEVNDVSPWRHQVWPHYALLTAGLAGLALQVLFEGLARMRKIFA